MKNFYFLVLLTVLAGCNDAGKPVLIVLPNGYEGEFQIVKDSIRGADPVERNGERVFDIPPSGLLRVKDLSPFYRWHTELYCYVNGRYISVESRGVVAGNRSTGPNSGEGSTDFDGTTHTYRVR